MDGTESQGPALKSTLSSALGDFKTVVRGRVWKVPSYCQKVIAKNSLRQAVPLVNICRLCLMALPKNVPLRVFQGLLK